MRKTPDILDFNCRNLTGVPSGFQDRLSILFIIRLLFRGVPSFDD